MTKKLISFCVFIACIGIIFSAYYYIFQYEHSEIKTDNAYVEANLLIIRSQLEAKVKDVYVDENQFVNKGDKLFSLDIDYYAKKSELIRTDIAIAKAALMEEQENRDLLKHKKVKNEWLLTEINNEIKIVELDISSLKQIAQLQFIAQQDLDKKLLSKKVLEARKNVQLSAIASIDVEQKLLEAKLAKFELHLRRFERELEIALHEINYGNIVAPKAGYVAELAIQKGEFIQVNSPLLTLIPEEDIWLQANFKESQVDKIVIGQQVNIVIDAYEKRRSFVGTVKSKAAAAGAKLNLIPPNYTSGNFTRVVQRVPIRITFNNITPQLRALLIPGLSAKVTIHLSDNSD